LGDRKIFSFQLYLYNPLNNKYYLFLHGNNPLISDRWQLMSTILGNGGGLAIRIDQKNTFLTTLEISEKDVPSLSGQPQVTQQAKKLLKEIKRQQEQATETPEKKFHLKDELLNSILGDDFSNLINQCRQEVLSFKITISHTVSLARFLVEELLYDDIFPNRVVALSFHLAKGMGINDPASLANLVVSALLYHMGMTQMDMGLLKKPNMELFDEERKKYRQHPGLTQHLLRKIQIDLDLRCFNIMLDHHERTDGSGYPNFKRQGYIDPLALSFSTLLGCSFPYLGISLWNGYRNENSPKKHSHEYQKQNAFTWPRIAIRRSSL